MSVIYTDKPLSKRTKNDFYETPLEVAETALSLLPLYKNKIILDVGCGTGIWGLAARNILAPSRLFGIDINKYTIRPDLYSELYCQDFMEPNIYGSIDLIIGNPPFSLAEQFIRTGFEILKGTGCLLFLLPLSFLESIKRQKGLFRSYPPTEVWVSSRRIGFTGQKTNPNACAIFIWVLQHQINVDRPTLHWLDWDWKYERSQVQKYLKGEINDYRIS